MLVSAASTVERRSALRRAACWMRVNSRFSQALTPKAAWGVLPTGRRTSCTFPRANRSRRSGRDVTLSGGRGEVSANGARDESANGNRGDESVQLQLDSAAASGVITWPAAVSASQPVDIHFARLNVQNGGPADSAAAGAAG